ncbi:MAG: histidinol dehydrogenase [Solirubrobacteraceae bacterium]|jgi:histidinol dehydrogenase|nr:histidinol dehydrogenase [Solirubrobacteraceae bacterium]
MAERWAVDGDPAGVAERARGLAPAAESVRDAVADIVGRVRSGGDGAVRDYTQLLDTRGAEAPPLRVGPDELAGALAALDADVRAGLVTAAANVAAVARAGLRETQELTLDQGQRILLREVPVGRAAVYVPGGRAPYPSTVVMGVVTARESGVGEVAVCAPPAADGQVHPTILAACALTGADEVYRMGGAQAVAALAFGTDTVAAVDVIVGPGNLYVQEAKRQVSGQVGTDGFAGPSDVLVVLEGAGVDPRWVALDLLAQAEHGPGTVVVAVSPDPSLLDAVAGELGDGDAQAPVVLLDAADLDEALAVAEAFAPEHLQLVGERAEALAPRVSRAGCVFVGPAGATAFGDYVAGSNHVLPTGGAARFASALSPAHFRRRMSEVHVGAAAPALAAAGAPVARAEGFVLHAESMEARMGEDRRP